jgi:ribonuclease H / adenosylcobalamin/alpha-ribazole phosphatase
MQSTDPTTVLFVRHAHTSALGVWLCGRACGVSLSSLGRAQAIALAGSLKSTPLAALYSSPLERAHETASAIATRQSCGIETCGDLTEIDFGEWTGQTFTALEHDRRWQTFNAARASAIIPGGERPADAQLRAVGAATRLAAAHPGETIALVTHADVIRMALLHFLSRSMDLYHSLTIDPASISTVVMSPSGAHVTSINRLADLQPRPLQCHD